MELLNLLATDQTALILVVGVLGLVVGSFLNVVIYRLPVMMEKEWRTECKKLLYPDTVEEKAVEPFNLIIPRSRCPHCGHHITALENIPVLSYLWQGGRCTACKKPISIRYPLIEISSALLAILTAWQMGYGLPLLGALIFTWALLAASMIDVDHHLLPDHITLPFMWLGILFNLFGVYTNLYDSVIGAMAGYLLLWAVFWLFKILTKKEGMGYGDFKMLALLGAWMGWQLLPVIILLSSVVGAVVGLLGILLLGRDKNVPIPFGPYLAGAGWITLLWGHDLVHAYLAWGQF